MPISKQDLGRDINFLVKILQDYNSNVKIQNTNTKDYKDIVSVLSQAVKENGLDQRHFSSLMKKLLISMDGWNSQVGNAVRSFEEIKDDKVDYGTLEKLLTPVSFHKTLVQALTKIKNLPIGLNSRENLSLLSKAIAKGQKEYASNGYGKYAVEFYKYASNKQVLALEQIRKNIKEGISVKEDKKGGGLLAGLASGIVAKTGDVIMENAGFGELPGKFMNMFTAWKDVFTKVKENKGDADVTRNAQLLEATKYSEASYNELRTNNEAARDKLAESEAARDVLTNSMNNNMKDILSRTSFGEKKKTNLQGKVEAGTLNTRDINAILNDWKKTLGDTITDDDVKRMDSFYEAMHSGVNDLKEIDETITQTRAEYNSNLNKENEALIVANKNRREIDKLMMKELEGQFSDIDKKMKGLGRNLSKDATEALRKDLQLGVTKDVREKFGINEAELRSMYSDNKGRITENLTQLGKSDKEANAEVNSDRFSGVINYTKDLKNKLLSLSDIFKENKIGVEPGKIPKRRHSNATITSTVYSPAKVKLPNVSPKETAVSKEIIDRVKLAAEKEEALPNGAPTIPLQSSVAPISEEISGQNIEGLAPRKTIADFERNPNSEGNRPNGVNTIATGLEYSKKQYELFKKIYGEDGSKFAEILAEKISSKIFKVEISGGNSGGSSATKTYNTTPPSTD